MSYSAWGVRIAGLSLLVALPALAQPEESDRKLERALLQSINATPPGVALLEEAGLAELCPPRAGGSVASAPTRDGYVMLLGELQREYAKRLGAGAEAIDRQLGKVKGDGSGSNAALPLSMIGGAEAAVYATLWSSSRNPQAALFASNLGSLLDGVGDRRAGQVLAYAVALSPGTVLPRLNLGWLHFHRGDLAAAKASFSAAAKVAPRSGVVLLGQGMVAHCEGDHRRAAELLSRAMSSVSSRAAEQALDESRAHESEQPAAPPGSITVPRRDDWTRGARAGRVSIAEPVVPGSNAEAITQGLSKNGSIIEGYKLQAERLVKRHEQLNPNQNRDRPPARAAGSVTLYRSDEAMAALARAQYAAYAAKIRGARAPFEADFEGQRQRVSDRMQAIMKDAEAQPEKLFALFCPPAKTALDHEYASFKAIWRGSWEAERKLIREYGELTGATISQIRHDDLRKYLDIERQLHIIGWGQDGPADMIGWGAVGSAIMNCGDPAPPPGVESIEPSDDAIKGPCPPFLQNGFGIDCGVASVTLDCEKISIQGGEGIIGRFEHNYVKHEQTYFVGVGFDATVGVGPLNAGAAGTAGAFVTAGSGQIRDVGVTGSATAAAGVFSMEGNVTVAAVSGPSATASAGVNLGPLSVPIH